MYSDNDKRLDGYIDDIERDEDDTEFDEDSDYTYERLGGDIDVIGIEYGIERDEHGHTRYVSKDNNSIDYDDSLEDIKSGVAGLLRNYWIQDEQDKFDSCHGYEQYTAMMTVFKMRDTVADITDEDDDKGFTPAAEIAEHAKARARNMLLDLRNACQFYSEYSWSYTFGDFEEAYTWSSCYATAREHLEACQQDDETRALARDLEASYAELKNLYETQTSHDMP